MNGKSLSTNIVARLMILALTFHCMTGFPVFADAALVPQPSQPNPLGGSRVTGEVTDTGASSLQLVLRSGQTMTVDLRAAEAKGMVPPIYAGEFIQVQGSLNAPGMMTAVAVTRAKSAPAAWSADIP